MGDPVCWMHLLDEDGRMPDPVDEAEEEGAAGAEAEEAAGPQRPA